MALGRVQREVARGALVVSLINLIAFNFIQDLPWYDEAAYHQRGLAVLRAGSNDPVGSWAEFIYYSPLYSWMAGGLDLILGVPGGIRVLWVLGGLSLVGSVAWLAQVLSVSTALKEGPRLWLLVVLTNSSLATCSIGVHRMATTFIVLAAAVALGYARRWWSVFMLALILALAVFSRLDALLAVPVIFMLWSLQLRRESGQNEKLWPRCYRRLMVGASVVAVVLVLISTSRLGLQRTWSSFVAFYQVLHYERLGAGLNPWMVNDLVAADFPGAQSLSDAWGIAPWRMLYFYTYSLVQGLNGAVTFSAPAANPNWWWLPYGFAVWFLVRRSRHGQGVIGDGLDARIACIFLALGLCSLSLFMAGAQPRYAVGFVVAELIFFGLLSIGGRSFGVLAWSVGAVWTGLGLWSTVAEMRRPKPNDMFIAAAQDEARRIGHPVTVAGSGANILCFYLGDQCHAVLGEGEEFCQYFVPGVDMVLTPSFRRHDFMHCRGGLALVPRLNRRDVDLWHWPAGSAGKGLSNRLY